MYIIFYILKQKLSFVGKILKGKELAPKIVFFAFLGIFLLVATAEFFGFFRAFHLLSSQEYFGPPLTLYVLEEFFLFIFILFIFSSVIAGFFIFFKSSDFRFLLSLPLSPGQVFNLKFLETLAVSSWPLILLVIPLIAALGIGSTKGPGYYIFSFVVSALFLFFSSFISVAVALLTGFVLNRLAPIAGGIGIILILLALAYSLIPILVPHTETLTRIFEATDLESSMVSTLHIESLFFWLPSHPVALAIFSSESDIYQSLNQILVLVLLTAAAGGIMLFLKKFLYGQLLLNWQEGLYYARTEESSAFLKRAYRRRSFPLFFRGKIGAWLEKDILSFVRNYQEISRAGFILFLLLIYLVAIVGAEKRIGRFLDNEGLIFALNLTVIAYFATTLSLRFIFPLVSLEGRAAWILWSSPLNRGKLFLGKFLIFGSLLWLAMEALLFFTTSSLGLSLFSLAVASFLLGFLIFTIVSISLYFGATYPNFHESNIDRLSTSAGGLLATFLSLAYGIFIGISAYRILGLESGYGFWLWIFTSLAVSVFLTGLMLKIGLKKIQRLEVV